MARKAWLRSLKEHGYPMEEAAYLRFIGRTVQAAQEILVDIFGPSLPFEQVFNRRQAYYDEDIDLNGIPVKAGLLELLRFLEEKSIPMAVGSSTPCWFAARKLDHVGLTSHFEAVVCGDMVERGKPEPDLFLEAARRLGIDPERCIVLEDSEAGIVAAYRAGMLPLMIPDLKPPSAEMEALAYRILPSLHEALPLFETFLCDGIPGIQG
jgi:beta-phosphoglucomutase-like phosphatase (HAD superfamily)